MARGFARKGIEMRRGQEAPVGRVALAEYQGDLVEAFVVKYLHYKYDAPAPIPQFHRDAWAVATNANISRFLLLAPRGHAKSSALTEAYGLSAMLFRQRDFALIVSNTYGQGVEFLGDIKQEILTNDALRADFGIVGLERDRDDDIIVLMSDGHRWRMVVKGSEQKVRGVKWNKRRPNLILFDDIEDDEQVVNGERRKKFARWFQNALMQCGSPDCLFRGAATILHFDSLAENLSKNSEWKTLRYRAHKSFDDFSQILWPERFNEAMLRSIKAEFKDNPDGYSQEYLNYPISESHAYFRREDLIEMSPEGRRVPQKCYAFWDLAISKTETADYTVGSIMGVTASPKYLVRDVRRGKWNALEIVNEIFLAQEAWKCEVHYIEKGALEKAIGPLLFTEMLKRRKWFTVEAVPSVMDKVSRAKTFQGMTRAHVVEFDKQASWWPDLEEEMLRFPKGEHDDQVDTLSGLGLKLQGLVPELTEEELEEEERQELMADAIPSGQNSVTGY